MVRATTQILADLALLGIVLQRHPTDPQRLRFYPRSRVTPVLLEEIRTHKEEILEMFGDQTLVTETQENRPKTEVSVAVTPDEEVVSGRDASRQLADVLGSLGNRPLLYLWSEDRFSIDLREKPTRDVGAVLRAGGLLQEAAPFLREHLNELESSGFIQSRRTNDMKKGNSLR